MRKLPGFQDVNSDQQNGGLDQYLTYDRATAARLGITAQALDSALYSAFGQQEVSIIYTQLNQYYVVLEVAPQFWQTPEGLKYIYLNSAERRQRAAQARSATARPTTFRFRSTTPVCSLRSRCHSIWRRAWRSATPPARWPRCSSG